MFIRELRLALMTKMGCKTVQHEITIEKECHRT
jgi:hypothetical protein